MAARIEDYAVVGDCETIALISRDGSVDWLCLPRFDSGACFAALLGTAEHGHWQLAPTGPIRHTRRAYRADTLILETDYETDEGAVTVVDFMPIRDHVPTLFRIVRGVRGRVEMAMDLTLRFDYGAVTPWVRRTDEGITAIAGANAVYLRTPVELRGEDFHTIAQFSIAAGESIPFALAWSPSYVAAPPPVEAEALLQQATEWWEEWSSHNTYIGPWRDEVMRSLITLKALTYAPTGGIVAAPTTSLPEWPGGPRNWDYRYCWLRDATFTLYALMGGGYLDEMRAWRDWLLRAVAGEPSKAAIMYTIAGERTLTETAIDWLPGYEQSQPVRIGNAARQQTQLDVYGEVIDSLYAATHAGLPHDANIWNIQRVLMEYLESAWLLPDEGIWEVRGGRRQFTFSKVMAWVAVDRSVRAIEEYGLEGPLERWKLLRDKIHAEVCARGYDVEHDTFGQYFGSHEPDASLLLLPIVGFLPATDPRILGTVRAVQERLMHHGFVRRYSPNDDLEGPLGPEGAFLACTCWLADNLVLQGRSDEARTIFERVLAVQNDLGLLAEQYDPIAKRQLGNFPQAFSHVALINTARNLSLVAGPAKIRAQRNSGEGQS